MSDDTRYDTPVIDLKDPFKVFDKGDIVAVLTWNRHTGQGCLVLLSKTIRDPRQIVPCIVSEGEAWVWSDQIGDYYEQESRAALFAAALQMTPDKRSIFKVISVIRDLVGEFGFMPPMPTEQEVVVADVIAVDQDGKETHQEVRDHV